jgi:hypothetical protein
MDTGGIVGLIVGVSLAISLIIVMMYAIRDDSLKTEAAKNKSNEKNKSDEGDKNRKELVEQYGEIEVLIAEYKQSLDQHAHGKTYGSLESYCIVEKDKQEKRDAQIKYIKSLSKEDLELYLLQEEAIKQIYKKYE